MAGDCELAIVLSVVPLDHPEARDLERKHIAEMGYRYGGAGPGPLHGRDFEAPGGCFVVVHADGAAVGCGGFRYLKPEIAEIKRMYVDDAVRGRGVGRRILASLEERAEAAGYSEAWLETGTEQPEAVSLYRSAGYRPIAAYGEFQHDDRCRCFARTLGS
ncbi:MAG TPA: GNAT family N-acetyltransferase [Acidimicrobiales bacterium]|nr:GNAT family N-acetyltransferase [Acidimicrobiales bacterium]